MKKTVKLPIAELSTLGRGVSSLIPAFRTVSTSVHVNTTGLYKLVNAGAGDALKAAKDGSFWGAMKTVQSTSKMAKFSEVGPLNATSTTAMPFNPATLMMAVVLLSIEKKLGEIEKMQKQILLHFEIEKESEEEGDLMTIQDIFTKYKYNWNNEHFIASNHKMVLDLQRIARKNILSYQKKTEESLIDKQVLLIHPQVDRRMKGMLKDFKYYRLALFTFAMASVAEVLLSGNLKSENILENKRTIDNFAFKYREQFTAYSKYLEKHVNKTIEVNTLRDLGNAQKSFENVISKIPIANKAPGLEELNNNSFKLLRSADNTGGGVLVSVGQK